MLDISNLYYAYRNRLVLNGINLTLDKGGLLTLLGRNGAGKSTLLNCIAGLLKPQRGRIMCRHYYGITSFRQVCNQA